MIKKVNNNVNIFIITESKWREWSKDNEQLTKVERILCSHTIQKLWIERSVFNEVLCNAEVMSVVYAHLGAPAVDVIESI